MSWFDRVRSGFGDAWAWVKGKYKQYADFGLPLKMILGTLITIALGPGVLGFLSTHATYRYAIANGFRVPLEGVSYIQPAVALGSYVLLIGGGVCFIVVLILTRYVIRAIVAVYVVGFLQTADGIRGRSPPPDAEPTAPAVGETPASAPPPANAPSTADGKSPVTDRKEVMERLRRMPAGRVFRIALIIWLLSALLVTLGRSVQDRPGRELADADRVAYEAADWAVEQVFGLSGADRHLRFFVGALVVTLPFAACFIFAAKPQWAWYPAFGAVFVFFAAAVYGMYSPDRYGWFLREIGYGGGIDARVELKDGVVKDKTRYEGSLMLRSEKCLVLREAGGDLREIPIEFVATIVYLRDLGLPPAAAPPVTVPAPP